MLEVPKWALKGAIGGFLIRRGGKRIPGVNFITYPCLHKVEVPTVNLTGIIKLIKEDEEYLTTLFYLIEDRQNIHLSVEYAKEYVKNHEMNHFRQYRARMLPYISFANSLDGELVCRGEKLKKYLDAYLAFSLALYYADGAELDANDYFGPAKIQALRERTKRYNDLYHKYLIYMKAYEEYYN